MNRPFATMPSEVIRICIQRWPESLGSRSYRVRIRRVIFGGFFAAARCSWGLWRTPRLDKAKHLKSGPELVYYGDPVATDSNTGGTFKKPGPSAARADEGE